MQIQEVKFSLARQFRISCERRRRAGLGPGNAAGRNMVLRKLQKRFGNAAVLRHSARLHKILDKIEYQIFEGEA